MINAVVTIILIVMIIAIIINIIIIITLLHYDACDSSCNAIIRISCLFFTETYLILNIISACNLLKDNSHSTQLSYIHLYVDTLLRMYVIIFDFYSITILYTYIYQSLLEFLFFCNIFL